jgi:hypothetical protein
MSGPYRDESTGVEARFRRAQRELADLRAKKILAVERYERSRRTLEARFATQEAILLRHAEPEPDRWDARSFWTGALWGALLALLMWPIVFFRHH